MGFATKSVFLFTILIFYAVIFTFMNYAFGTSTGIVSSSEASNIWTHTGIGLFDFIGNIIVGITILPIWINAIIFTPLILSLGYILVTSLPTFNGGS